MCAQRHPAAAIRFASPAPDFRLFWSLTPPVDDVSPAVFQSASQQSQKPQPWIDSLVVLRLKSGQLTERLRTPAFQFHPLLTANCTDCERELKPRLPGAL